jgi:hypothetical protein
MYSVEMNELTMTSCQLETELSKLKIWNEANLPFSSHYPYNTRVGHQSKKTNKTVSI